MQQRLERGGGGEARDEHDGREQEGRRGFSGHRRPIAVAPPAGLAAHRVPATSAAYAASPAMFVHGSKRIWLLGTRPAIASTSEPAINSVAT